MLTNPDPSLTQRAIALLDGNWIGGATKPAPRLYPHQWSWDSAFIAIGNRHRHWDRAVEELTTLFDAQWTNGMVPHIVFGPEDSGYFPAGSFWQSYRSPACPDGISSSGICQPAIHASAVLEVFRAKSDDEGKRFIEDLVPRLVAWHDYLHRERTVAGPLIEIWHPWESGRDNNPEWDAALRAVRFAPEDVPAYQRADINHADPGDRPSDAEYDRYLFLVERLKADRYLSPSPEKLPFRIRDVLFNAILVKAEMDLALLCELVGLDGEARRERAASLRDAIDGELWSDESGMYHSMDASTGQLIPMRTSGAFLPLIMGRLEDDRLEPLLDTFVNDFLVPFGDHGRVPLTIPVDEAGFDAARYWRGPAWVNMSWLIAIGLDLQDRNDLADEIRQGVLALCDEIGFFEYFDPRNGSGHGSDDFSWSAALALDLASTDGARVLGSG